MAYKINVFKDKQELLCNLAKAFGLQNYRCSEHKETMPYRCWWRQDSGRTQSPYCLKNVSSMNFDWSGLNIYIQ